MLSSLHFALGGDRVATVIEVVLGSLLGRFWCVGALVVLQFLAHAISHGEAEFAGVGGKVEFVEGDDVVVAAHKLLPVLVLGVGFATVEGFAFALVVQLLHSGGAELCRAETIIHLQKFIIIINNLKWLKK